MNEDHIQRKHFRGLKAISYVCKVLAGIIVIGAIGIGLLVGVSQASNVEVLGRASIPVHLVVVNVIASIMLFGFYGGFVAVVLYTISQLIEVAISMNDSLHTISQNDALLQEMKRTNNLLNLQYQRLTGLYEQQQQRLDNLEKNGQP